MAVQTNIGQEDIPVKGQMGLSKWAEWGKEHLKTDIDYGQGGPRGKEKVWDKVKTQAYVDLKQEKSITTGTSLLLGVEHYGKWVSGER